MIECVVDDIVRAWPIWLKWQKRASNRVVHSLTPCATRLPFQVAKNTILRCYYLLLSGPSSLQLKNGQLGPDNNTSNLRAQFFSKQNVLKPYFIVFLTNSVL